MVQFLLLDLDPTLWFATGAVLLFAISVALYSKLIHLPPTSSSSAHSSSQSSSTIPNSGVHSRSKSPDQNQPSSAGTASSSAPSSPVARNDDNNISTSDQEFQNGQEEINNPSFPSSPSATTTTTSRRNRLESASRHQATEIRPTLYSPSNSNHTFAVRPFGFVINFVLTKLPLRHGIFFDSSSLLSLWCLFQHDDLVFTSVFSIALFWCLSHLHYAPISKAEDDDEDDDEEAKAASTSGSGSGGATVAAGDPDPHHHQQHRHHFHRHRHQYHDEGATDRQHRGKQRQSRQASLALTAWMSFALGNISCYVLDSFVVGLSRHDHHHRQLVNVGSNHLAVSQDEKVADHHHHHHHHYCQPFRGTSAAATTANRNIALLNLSSTPDCLSSFSLFRRSESVDGRFLSTPLRLCPGEVVVIAGDSVKVSNLGIASSETEIRVLGRDVILDNVTVECRTSSSATSSTLSSCFAVAAASIDSLVIHNLTLIVIGSGADDDVDRVVTINSKNINDLDVATTTTTTTTTMMMMTPQHQGKSLVRKDTTLLFDRNINNNNPASKIASAKFSWFFAKSEMSPQQSVELPNKDDDDDRADSAVGVDPRVKPFFDVVFTSTRNENGAKNAPIDNIVIRVIDDDQQLQQDLWACSSYPRRLSLLLPVGLRFLRKTTQTLFPVLTKFFSDVVVPASTSLLELVAEFSANVGCGILDVHAHHKNAHHQEQQQQQQQQSTILSHSLPPQDQKRIITVIWSSRSIHCIGRNPQHEQRHHQPQQQQLSETSSSSSSTSTTTTSTTSSSSSSSSTSPSTTMSNNNVKDINDNNDINGRNIVFIAVPYRSPTRAVFRELSIAISWFAGSFGWRIVAWSWNQEVAIVWWILETCWDCLLVPIWSVLACVCEGVVGLSVDLYNSSRSSNDHEQARNAVAFASAFLSAWSAFAFANFVLPVFSFAFDQFLVILAFVGKWYSTYVGWARDMEMLIYAAIWEPIQRLLAFAFSSAASLCWEFFKSTFNVTFKIHFLLSMAQTGFLIYSVWYAFRVRQMRKEEQEMMKRENLRRKSELQQQRMRQPHLNLDGKRSVASVAGAISSFFAGLIPKTSVPAQEAQNVQLASASAASSLLSFVSTIITTTTTTTAAAAASSSSGSSPTMLTTTPSTSRQISLMLTVSRWYDQLQTVFSASLWKHCLEWLMIWFVVLFLRMIPLPIGMLNVMAETYLFPILTTTGFATAYCTEREQIQEKHLIMLIDEVALELEMEGDEEDAEGSPSRTKNKSERRFIRLQEALRQEESRQQVEDVVGNTLVLICRDWRMIVIVRLVVAVLFEIMFGRLIDVIWDQVAQLIKLGFFFGVVFALFKCHQLWTFAKGFFGSSPPGATVPATEIRQQQQELVLPEAEAEAAQQ